MLTHKATPLSIQQQLAEANAKLAEALLRNTELEDERGCLIDQLEDLFVRFEEEFRAAMLKEVGMLVRQPQLKSTRRSR